MKYGCSCRIKLRRTVIWDLNRGVSSIESSVHLCLRIENEKGWKKLKEKEEKRKKARAVRDIDPELD